MNKKEKYKIMDTLNSVRIMLQSARSRLENDRRCSYSIDNASRDVFRAIEMIRNYFQYEFDIYVGEGESIKDSVSRVLPGLASRLKDREQ